MRSVLLPIVLLSVAKSSSFVDGSGNVGCLFSEDLCKPETQWCYDDGAFGRCLPTGPGADDEIYRHNLQQDDLEKLEFELGQLLQNGYRWSHRHTQCVLQALLHSIRTGSAFDRIICDRLKERDLESALNSGDVDDEVDPESLAYIKYGPNDNDQSPDFARIVYYSTKDRNPDDGVYGVEEDVEYDEPYTLVRRSLPETWESDHFSTLYNTPDHFRSGFELKDLPGERLLREAPKAGDDEVLKEDEDYYDEDPDFMVPIRDKISSVVPPNFLENPDIAQDWNDDDDDDIDDNEADDQPLFLIPSDQPSQFGPMFESPGSSIDEGYTEGGVISIPNAQGYQEMQDMQDMQDSWLESLGFKRRERLDVKKPGPPYDPAFQKKLTTEKPKLNETERKGEGQKEDISNALPMQPMKLIFSPKSRSVKKIVEDEIPDNSQYDVIDTTYTYIEFRNDINTWKEGRAIVDKVADLLKVPKELFTKERVDRNEVTFQVKEPNSYGLNGTEVARKIESIKDDLGKTAGVFITGYGIGNKSKLPSAKQLDIRPDHEVYVVSVIVCGVLAALTLSAGVLYLTRRHGYKLANMTSGDTESSKLYQNRPFF
uniref:Protein-tyrosine phosphatase receptor IA-2 ectodomain domain-containing protein n=1 Tax=Lygus hesperus TaxID=30085 RepID=A0A0K8SXI2_LYGHE